ncbi:type I polyketide synthase [uncultured Thermanaerothrix sp.]|uniref:type I polyketide synthase n=1 Tax=uncultured Thermanaerothrix sp. TaxID=1195149 RepID=UPI002633B29F|nr:type I polyketide synthase [uncultured Thermanaerothrix sp.]
MSETKAVAIVGVGAILPDAPDAPTFWKNIKQGRYSVTEVPRERWDPDLYYDPDPRVPDKTYTKIGAWVREFRFEPLKWGIPIPPNVLAVMDNTQKWAIAAAREALLDYGYPERYLDPTRVAVILGNSMAGENQYNTSLRVRLPEYLEALRELEVFRDLPPDVQRTLLEGVAAKIRAKLPPITEDTMPGELANIIAGRVANVFNFSGANFITDAACASSLAALQAAIEGLNNYQFDAVLTGGVDGNMSIDAYVKFCKIGALSPDGSRPFAEGANGFVMGEGAAVFLLKRLADAERDGDKIYAVIRGVGSSSDGRGKGITAPNPTGQQRAIERAWKNAGLSPATATLIEAHGTSTRVGDVVEVNSLNAIFDPFDLPVASIALGSVKSNIGHLKSAAGAAALLKVTFALYEKVLPPSINFTRPNPNIDFDHLPFYVITELRPWERPRGEIRRAGISSFGFGGTNFHAVVEEYVPGLLTSEKKVFPAVAVTQVEATRESLTTGALEGLPTYRGLLVIGASDRTALIQRLHGVLEEARAGRTPAWKTPALEEIRQPERLALDYADAADLVKRLEKALTALEKDAPETWQALAGQGIYRGRGAPGKVAFLFPGQGSQYVNMLRDLYDLDPVVATTFREADTVMTPILGRPLSDFIFVADGDERLKQAEAELRNTIVTQPAMLTANVALLRLLAKYGFHPDMAIGHSLGEYAALVAAEALPFAEALEIVSARGREMARVSMADNGCMAAVSAPPEAIEHILGQVPGYVVVANYNSPLQSVIGGETAAVDAAIRALQAAGYQAVKIPVSHAFHTQIVAPASEPLRKIIARMHLRPPRIPVISNVTGEFYPTERERMLDLLARQVASPVQFIHGVQTLYAHGARIFVEVGPKRVLAGLASDILREKASEVVILATNHPRKGGPASFNEALAGLLAAGVLPQRVEERALPVQVTPAVEAATVVSSAPLAPQAAPTLVVRDGRLPLTGSVVISGAGLGLPGRQRAVFADDNVERLLRGEIMIEPLPLEVRQSLLQRRIIRLIKSDNGAEVQPVEDLEQTVKLAGQRGQFDLSVDFGVPAERVEALDISTQLAIAAGIEALRDAGIPLVMHYRPTSVGTYLPDRWRLPPALADETGVIFASAFPGLSELAREIEDYYQYETLKRQLDALRALVDPINETAPNAVPVLRAQIAALERQLAEQDYHLDRRLVFRALTMGHSQFAEYIGARGPNTHVNAACASTTHALALAEDWIRQGRCRRVIIIAGDDVTSNPLMSWIGASLMASGAATIEGDLRQAVLPFDRRRNGMIMGMGAAALVVESEDAVRERGMRGICEVLATDIANSAYHGTRLDVTHVSEIMERVVRTAEQRFGLHRAMMAPYMVFVSHETYTPARGGSASAEIRALRQVFGEHANRILIANTKGYTGHAMGVGIEDVLAVKALQYGRVPPIANIDDGFEPDPELGDLNLSRGGVFPLRFALRLGAGFGSQVAMALLRRIDGHGERVDPRVYERWLADLAGYERAELEVVQRTLRIRHAGPPQRPPLQSRWQYGQGPTQWAEATGPEETMEALQPSPSPQQPEPFPSSQPTLPVLDEHQITEFVLNLVSERTGYPRDMLDLDLDLEADLGIDTVKQAELFAAVREQYGIPRREDVRLVDYNTLRKVIGFVREAVGSLPQVARAVSQADSGLETYLRPSMEGEDQEQRGTAKSGLGLPSEEEIQAVLVALVSEKTGYPPEMLDLDLDLEADLGIDTVKQAELFAAVRERYGIPRREDLRLVDYNTLRKVIAFVRESLEMQASSDLQPTTLSVSPLPSETVSPEVLELVTARVGYPVDHLPIQAHSPASQAEEVSPSAPGRPGAIDEEAIRTFVLSLVSEKTGYPQEMLDLDLDLEADLGIDTVKQAELFATVREQYGIPRREDLRLSDYNTLRKVIAFVQEAVALQATPLETEKAGEAAAISFEQGEGVPTTPLQSATKDTSVIRRRIPQAVLRPRATLCQPTGIDLAAGLRVIVVEDQGGVGTALARRLRARKVKVLVVSAEVPEQAKARVQEWAQEGTVDGLFFLPGLDPHPDLAAVEIEQWQAEVQRRAQTLFDLLQSLPGELFVVAATRLDGRHGFSGEPLAAPLGGLVSGLVKAVAWERANALVKVVDFAPQAEAAEIAVQLIEELLYDPGIVEVGRYQGQRYGVTLVEAPLDAVADLEWGEKPVFLITGGSGGITQAVVRDLARQTRGVFYLIGRSPLPAPEDPDLVLLRRDRSALRQTLLKRLAAEGRRPSLAEVEQHLAALDRADGMLKLLDEVRSWGAEMTYLAADVTHPQAVEEVVARVIREQGRLDVLIHAAGIERSRRLESKPPEEFVQILAVKAQGFYHLYKALHHHRVWPRAMIAFTSIAGRFGNAGQVDYCAGNDFLAKIMLALRHHPARMKTIALDWGAWAEVGMASRGHVPELMRRAGIDLMQPEEAAGWVYRELATNSGQPEVVLAGSLGLLTLPRREHDGLDIEAIKSLTGSDLHRLPGMLTKYDRWEGARFEVELDPQETPYLSDHALNGIPLLPAVMGLEGFATAALRWLNLSSEEGSAWQVKGFSEVQFMAPLKFYRSQPRRFAIQIHLYPVGEGFIAQATLESTLVRAGMPPQTLRHFTAKVHLGALEQGDGPETGVPSWDESRLVPREAIYRLFFHGPAFQVLEAVQIEPHRAVGRLYTHLPTLSPAPLVTQPHLLELVLQTAATWEVAQDGVLALPSGAERILFTAREWQEPVWAEVIPVQSQGENRRFDARVVDARGRVIMEVTGYQTARLPYAAEAMRVAPFRAAINREEGN